MNTYYTGKHASRYNRTWRTFLQKTLSATLSAIDVASLQQRASRRERPLRILDAACGTGLLLEQFTHLFPHAELYGIDESQAMLAQMFIWSRHPLEVAKRQAFPMHLPPLT